MDIGTPLILVINGERITKANDLSAVTTSGKVPITTLSQIIGYQEGPGEVNITGSVAFTNGRTEVDFWNMCQPGSTTYRVQFVMGSLTYTNDGWFEEVTFAHQSGSPTSVNFTIKCVPSEAE